MSVLATADHLTDHLAAVVTTEEPACNGSAFKRLIDVLASTVGLVAFGLLFGKLINWLPPTSSVLIPALIAMAIASALAGLGWVSLGKLPPDFRRQVRRIIEDVVPYYKLFGACVIGLGTGVWLLVSGELGFGVLTISFCGLVIWGYMRFR